MDNYSTRKHTLVKNQVERFFAHISEKAIPPGSVRSDKELVFKIDAVSLTTTNTASLLSGPPRQPPYRRSWKDLPRGSVGQDATSAHSASRHEQHI